MGAAVLITLGILFLIQEFWYIEIDRTIPVLLIVIGIILFASRTASTEGHIQPSWVPGTYQQTPPAPSDPNQPGGGPQVKQ